MSKIALRIDNVSKDFSLPHLKANSVKSLFTGFYKQRGKQANEVQHAIRDISFEINEGEFFGIVGRNGSGKSTLLKILAGIYQPSKGSITTHGKLVPFIELGVGFNPELTGRENVYLNGAMLGFSPAQIDAMYDEIVAFAELERFMDQKLKNYSSGMQVRLAFSMATRAEADILLVDEVLAVGDADFQKKCFRYFRDLKKQKKTVVFVSHDMNAVQEYCDRAVLIEDSRLVTEGSAFDVGNAYTRMFLDQALASQKAEDAKRWGDGIVTYSQVYIKPAELTNNDNKVTLSTTVSVHEDTPQAVFGFKVRAEDDTSLIGSNTQLKHQKLTNLKKGDQVDVVWTFPNIFNTGLYFIDVAAQDSSYEVMHDMWEASCSFKVDRKEDSSYPVHPPIDVAVKVKGN